MQYDESDGRFRIGFGKYYDGGGWDIRSMKSLSLAGKKLSLTLHLSSYDLIQVGDSGRSSW